MTNSSALVLLIGGNEHVARAQSIMACSAGAPAINACDLKLDDALALLHYADLRHEFRPDEPRRGRCYAGFCVVWG